MTCKLAICTLLLCLLVAASAIEKKTNAAADDKLVTELTRALQDLDKRWSPDWWKRMRESWKNRGYPGRGNWRGRDRSDDKKWRSRDRSDDKKWRGRGRSDDSDDRDWSNDKRNVAATKREYSDVEKILTRMLVAKRLKAGADDTPDSKTDDKTSNDDDVAAGITASKKSQLANILKRVLNDDTPDDQTDDKTNDKTDDSDHITSTKRSHDDLNEVLKRVLMTERQTIFPRPDTESADKTPDDQTDDQDDNTNDNTDDNDGNRATTTTKRSKSDSGLVQLLKRLLVDGRKVAGSDDKADADDKSDKSHDKSDDKSDDGKSRPNSNRKTLLITVLKRLLQTDQQGSDAAQAVATRADKIRGDSTPDDDHTDDDDAVNAVMRDFEDELKMVDKEREERGWKKGKKQKAKKPKGKKVSFFQKLKGKKQKKPKKQKGISRVSSCKKRGKFCSSKKDSCCYPYFCKKIISIASFGKCT